MLVRPLPSHTLTLARPASAMTHKSLHAGSFAPRTGLFPAEDLLSLLEDAPKDPCYTSCSAEIVSYLDNTTRNQTNFLLFLAWLHFVFVMASMRD